MRFEMFHYSDALINILLYVKRVKLSIKGITCVVFIPICKPICEMCENCLSMHI